jgi:hypothetical protein
MKGEDRIKEFKNWSMKEWEKLNAERGRLNAKNHTADCREISRLTFHVSRIAH